MANHVCSRNRDLPKKQIDMGSLWLMKLCFIELWIFYTGSLDPGTTKNKLVDRNQNETLKLNCFTLNILHSLDVPTSKTSTALIQRLRASSLSRWEVVARLFLTWQSFSRRELSPWTLRAISLIVARHGTDEKRTLVRAHGSFRQQPFTEFSCFVGQSYKPRFK